jgi:hypothetical protein
MKSCSLKFRFQLASVELACSKKAPYTPQLMIIKMTKAKQIKSSVFLLHTHTTTASRTPHILTELGNRIYI